MASREDSASLKGDLENYNQDHERDPLQHLRQSSFDSKKSASRVSLAESTNTMPPPSPGVPPKLPEPLFEDSPLSFEQILADSKLSFEDYSKDPAENQASVYKRASNVLRLAEENEKLNAELNALQERLREAEERAKALEVQRRERESATTQEHESSTSSG